MKGTRSYRVAAIAASMLAFAGAGFAGVCNVPGSHPTIQAAIDDPACSEIALAEQVFRESPSVARDLTIRGSGAGTSVIEGLLTIVGNEVQVTIEDFGISPNNPGALDQVLAVSGGAQVTALRVVARHYKLFADGFE